MPSLTPGLAVRLGASGALRDVHFYLPLLSHLACAPSLFSHSLLFLSLHTLFLFP